MTAPSQCDLILATLGHGNYVTTLQLSRVSGSLAVHSRIAELRARGYEIEHDRKAIGGRLGGKRMVSAYRLVKKVAA